MNSKPLPFPTAEEVQLNTIETLRRENQRLTDLVRFCRIELNEAELISMEEYAALSGVKGSPARLETYDEMRDQLTTLKQSLAKAEEQLAVNCKCAETATYIAKLEADAAVKHEALQRLWDDDEMGWILTDNTAGGECVKCGASTKENNLSSIRHEEGCVQGYIYEALQPNTGTELLAKVERYKKALEEIRNEHASHVRLRHIAQQALEESK